MSVHALHEGIQYRLVEIRSGEWEWSFLPPTGPQKTGRARGDARWAITVVQRAIGIWHLMNRCAEAARGGHAASRGEFKLKHVSLIPPNVGIQDHKREHAARLPAAGRSEL
jgi:hypothetical protein